MVVVHVFGSLDRGGAELRTLQAVEALPPDRVRSVYVCLSGRRGALADRAEAAGDRVVPLALGPRFAVRFVRMLRTERADVVHSHVATFSGLVVTLARLARVPRRICHFRSDGDEHGYGLGRRSQRWLMRALASWSATDIIGVSPGALTHGYRADWRADLRCAVVANGLPTASLPSGDRIRHTTRSRYGVAADARLVVFVGKSSPAKDVGRAIRLAEDVGNMDPRVGFLFVGEFSPQHSRAIAAVGRSTGAEGIRALGVCDDVPAILHAADVTLLTSRREGLPGVVLESLAVGTPVLSSDLSGTRWIDELTGGVSLVPVETSDEQWSQELHGMLETSDRRREEIRADFARSPFRLERTVAAFSSLWRRYPERFDDRSPFGTPDC